MTTLEDAQPRTAFDKAILLYKKETFPQTKLLTDLMEYARFHYVYCSPDCIIMAKVVEGRGWFIHLAVGNGHLETFFKMAPFELEFIGFARPENGRDTRWYQWKRLYDYCHKKR